MFAIFTASFALKGSAHSVLKSLINFLLSVPFKPNIFACFSA